MLTLTMNAPKTLNNLANLVLVPAENIFDKFFVIDSGDDPMVQKRIRNVLRLNGILVTTSKLKLDIHRRAFLLKTIRRQGQERKSGIIGAMKGSGSKVCAAAGLVLVRLGCNG